MDRKTHDIIRAAQRIDWGLNRTHHYPDSERVARDYSVPLSEKLTIAALISGLFGIVSIVLYLIMQ